MKLLLVGAAALSVALGAGAACANNPNVPPNSPYAVMAPDVSYSPPPTIQRREYARRGYRRREGRATFVPGYVHDTGPPPGLMVDQPSTIGGYPIGY
jgi:hypothetical protein